MAITWYGSPSPAEGCNLGALAVLWPLLERMQVARIINQHLPADPQAEFDHGRVLNLLIAARLCNPVALVNVGRWAAESGADILWGIPVEKLNDDRLGRSVEAYFGQRHSILASLALHVAEEFGVPLSEIHYDPTHILLHGAYEGSQPRGEVQTDDGIHSDARMPPAHITQGRPMSDAPNDVQMIHAGLCTVVDEWGPLPIFGHTVDGNQNGHPAVAEQLALLRKHLRPPELTMISDRGTFSLGHLLRLEDAGYHAIVAAPWDEFRPLFDQHQAGLKWKKAPYLSIEQQRRRRQGHLPQEHYEMVPLSKEEREQLAAPKRGCRRPAYRFQFSYDAQTAEHDAAYDGYSVLVTTAPREQSAELVFIKYKQRGYSELANHQFKTPLAVHPLFLKSPPRVEALVFLMMMALTAYFLLQRIYRQSVPAKATVQEHRTTTETLLRAFSNYTLLIHHTRLGREVQTTRLTTRQRQILQQLGFESPAQILSHHLPRAP
jgi:hypothetical protein